MAFCRADLDIDWTKCELIERVEGKVSGRPVVRGTRILPDPVVNSFDLGDSVEELGAAYPSLTPAQITRLIDFAHSQQIQPFQ